MTTHQPADQAAPAIEVPAIEVPAIEVPAIEVHGLRRTYGSGKDAFDAVRGIDFTVERGSITAILGVNGAGKTSALEVIEGLSAASAGEICVLGLDPIKDRREVRARTGVLLQTSGFSGDLTVAETCAMWRSTLSNPITVDEALAMVDLTDRAGTPMRALSGGETRRVDLACALMGNPELVILDEPTTGLDPESRRRVWHLLRSLRARGTTILFSTHYLEEAEELADDLLIMAAGEIVRRGTPLSIVAEQPSQISFAALTASLPDFTGTEQVEHDGQHLTIRTYTLQTTLTDVLVWARDNAIELAELSAQPASLEAVFLSIADSTRSPATGTDAGPTTNDDFALKGATR